MPRKANPRMTRVYVPQMVSAAVQHCVASVAYPAGCEVFEIYGSNSGCRLPVAARNAVVEIMRRHFYIRTPSKGRAGCPEFWWIGLGPPKGFIQIPYSLLARLIGLRSARNVFATMSRDVRLPNHDAVVECVDMTHFFGMHRLDAQNLAAKRAVDRAYRTYRKAYKQRQAELKKAL